MTDKPKQDDAKQSRDIEAERAQIAAERAQHAQEIAALEARLTKAEEKAAAAAAAPKADQSSFFGKSKAQPIVEKRDVEVVLKSYIGDAFREEGDLIPGYSGPVGRNLRVGTIKQDRRGEQYFEADDDNGSD